MPSVWTDQGTGTSGGGGSYLLGLEGPTLASAASITLTETFHKVTGVAAISTLAGGRQWQLFFLESVAGFTIGAEANIVGFAGLVPVGSTLMGYFDGTTYYVAGITQTGATTAFTPTGNIAATTVAGALAELDAEKVAKAGDTMAGLGIFAAGLQVTGDTPGVTVGAMKLGYAAAVNRIYMGDGSGFSLAFAKRVASVTTDLFTLTDAGNVTIPGSLGIGGAPGYNLDTFGTGNITSAVRSTLTTGVAKTYLAVGNGVGSTRYAYSQFQSLETVGRNWVAGLYGTLSYQIHDATAGVTRVEIDTIGNLGFGGASFGGGAVVMFYRNRTTAPTTNPVDGVLVYAEAGALKARGSSGTVTTIAVA